MKGECDVNPGICVVLDNHLTQTTQCPSASSKWINTLVHPHSGILLSNKKEWADKHNNLDGSQMHYAKRKNHINVCQLWLKQFKKKNRLKRLHIKDSIYMIIWRRQKLEGQKTDQGLSGGWVDYKGVWENFRGWWKCVISWLWWFHECMYLSKLIP